MRTEGGEEDAAALDEASSSCFEPFPKLFERHSTEAAPALGLAAGAGSEAGKLEVEALGAGELAAEVPQAETSQVGELKAPEVEASEAGALEAEVLGDSPGKGTRSEVAGVVSGDSSGAKSLSSPLFSKAAAAPAVDCFNKARKSKGAFGIQGITPGYNRQEAISVKSGRIHMPRTPEALERR